MKAVRTASTRREKYLSQSTAIWEQWSIKITELFRPSLGMKGASFKRGKCQRRYAGLCRILGAFGRMDAEK